MLDEILGLPAHPLVIHAAVVLIPLLAVVAVGYAVLPSWRTRLGWAVVLLAVAAPLSAIVSRATGLALVDNLFGGEYPEGVLGQRVEEHANLSLPLLGSTVALGVVSLLLVWFARRAGGAAGDSGAGHRATAVKTSAGNTTVTMVLSVVTIVLALAALYFVLRTGHSGALAVWGK